jgi:hypothetical protein
MLAAFLVGVEIYFKEIGEKENFQNNKHYKQFNKDDCPHLATSLAKVLKTTEIKLPNPDYDVLLSH